jgi:hypothetical protein
VRVRTVSFVIPDPPPLRQHPGRGAGVGDPYAALLIRAGRTAAAADPDAFPFQFRGVTVRYGRTAWNVSPLGYQPDHPNLEVLAAAGAVWDPEHWWSTGSQDSTSDYYVVTFTSEDPAERGPRNETITAWTDVPEQYRGGRAPRSI